MSEEPDGDIHGECAAEIRKQAATIKEMRELLDQASRMSDVRATRLFDEIKELLGRTK